MSSTRFNHLPLPLFLDFDGVLHHFFPLPGNTDEQNAKFAFLPAFEAAVRQSPRPVQIIISSTWRRTKTLSELRALFSADIADLITDVTPAQGLGNGPGARHAEVVAWMGSRNRLGQPWVGIDDFPELYRPGDTVVACRDRFGEREASLLLEAIADPLGFAQRHPVVENTEARGKPRVVVPGTI